MSKNVLLIDDEKLVTKSLQKLLNQEGYNAIAVNSVAFALRKIKNIDFDLIVSDIRMPGVGGVEGLQKIRSTLLRLDKPAVPEILMTGYKDLDKYEEAVSLDVAMFIYKPFDNDKFLEIVKKFF